MNGGYCVILFNSFNLAVKEERAQLAKKKSYFIRIMHSCILELLVRFSMQRLIFHFQIWEDSFAEKNGFNDQVIADLKIYSDRLEQSYF